MSNVRNLKMINSIAHFTPEEFEQHVQRMLEDSGIDLSDFYTQRREKIQGKDGEYEIDVTARFKALNTEFLVLIECKHHKHPIKREVIQVLRDRMESIGAQKGMLFSSVRFQSGAVEYAKAHKIALIKVTDSEPVYFNRAGGNFDHDSIPTCKGAWLVHQNVEDNIMNTRLGVGDPYLILNEIGIPAAPKNGCEMIRISGQDET